jgi:hypothetical protein
MIVPYNELTFIYREKTAFMETSLFERAEKHIPNGGWLYKEVIINIVFRLFELNFSMTS